MVMDVIFRVIGALAFGLGGLSLGSWVVGRIGAAGSEVPWLASLGLGGAVLGALIAPYLTTRPLRWAWRQVREMPLPLLLVMALALTLTLVIAVLLALPLSLLPGLYGKLLPLVITLLLACLGLSIMAMRSHELLELLGPRFPEVRAGLGRDAGQDRRVLVDTSAIIDGRIADISKSGFLRGPLLVPRFVLSELQGIADSPDALRRKRGRRGLEMLNRLQKESNVPVQVVDVNFQDVEGVDSKLVRLAQAWRCPIITSDFNLNRVAELQGVNVLNVNELANALKPVVLPGEEMEIQIIQEGKEAGQGVGFLDDGTMVVVEGGRRFLNNRIDIVVTRVLQTAAGRMVFAHLKNGGSP